jgi:hypothetical protein
MKGSCPSCLEKQKIRGLEDYCCVMCVVTLAAPGARMYKDEYGTTVIDMSGRQPVKGGE